MLSIQFFLLITIRIIILNVPGSRLIVTIITIGTQFIFRVPNNVEYEPLVFAKNQSKRTRLSKADRIGPIIASGNFPFSSGDFRTPAALHLVFRKIRETLPVRSNFIPGRFPDTLFQAARPPEDSFTFQFIIKRIFTLEIRVGTSITGGEQERGARVLSNRRIFVYCACFFLFVLFSVVIGV